MTFFYLLNGVLMARDFFPNSFVSADRVATADEIVANTPVDPVATDEALALEVQGADSEQTSG
jgi:hypothetical protein